MKIITKLVSVNYEPNNSFNFLGQSHVVKRDKFTLVFNSKDARIDIEISEGSKVYDHLAAFRHKNGEDADFIFDIAGENINSYFSKMITDLDTKISEISKISETRLGIIIKQQSSVNELAIVKTKWWYKLFTYFSAK